MTDPSAVEQVAEAISAEYYTQGSDWSRDWDWQAVARKALTAAAGLGWVGPEEAGKLRAEADAREERAWNDGWATASEAITEAIKAEPEPKAIGAFAWFEGRRVGLMEAAKIASRFGAGRRTETAREGTQRPRRAPNGVAAGNRAHEAQRPSQGHVADGDVDDGEVADGKCPSCGKPVRRHWINADSAIHGPGTIKARWWCDTTGCHWNPDTTAASGRETT